MGGASPISYHNYLQVYDPEVLGDPERDDARIGFGSRDVGEPVAPTVHRPGLNPVLPASNL